MCCEWHALSLVVVNDLYVVGVALPEDKANAPPCVHRHCPIGRCGLPIKFVRHEPLFARRLLRLARFVAAIPNCYSEKTRSGKQTFVVTGKLHVLFLRSHKLKG